ncbi:hypothetical protein Hanom_Chr08g00742771 [Helianthus anomalus]
MYFTKKKLHHLSIHLVSCMPIPIKTLPRCKMTKMSLASIFFEQYYKPIMPNNIKRCNTKHTL